MRATFKSYLIGFILSIVLTLAAYFAVIAHVLSNGALIVAIIVLAVVQLMVQLFYFLHLGQESNPRWNLVFFISTAGIVLLVVVGSLWIMNHLNYNMTPDQMNVYMMKSEGMQK